MPFLVEVVVNGAVNRGEFLQTSHPSEPEHRPFSSPERQVRVLSPVVEPSPYFATITSAEVFQRRTVGSKAIRHNALWPAVPFYRFLQ